MGPHVHPTEVDVQDTVISTGGDAQDSVPLVVPRGASVDVDTQAAAVEVFAMSDCSDTESCIDVAAHQSSARTRRRLSRPIMGVSGSDIESDVPNRRRRLRVVRNDDPNSEAQTALTRLNVLTRRVGAVPVGAPVPVAIRQHRWSPLFVPLLWSAAGIEATTPVLEMLVSTASSVSEPIQFHGSNTAAAEAVRVGWTALRGVLRMWAVDAQLQLSDWLRNQGFAATRPGHHIPARAQERILSQACEVDARVALLEAVFVTTVLHLGRLSGIPAVTRDRAPEVRRIRQSVPATVPSASWAQLDHVNLQDWFARRCPMLKTCPYFMRGRLRQSLAVALRERSGAKDGGDVVGEERAWKVFGLIPMMLLHRPRGTGSIGREELSKRADDFAHGRFSQLLSRANQVAESQRHTRNTVTDTIERRGRAAQSRVEAGQVSRARQQLIGASLAPKTQATFDELQGKRPQHQMREIPPAVLAFVPERPLEQDFSLFIKCLQSPPSGRSPGPGGCSNEMWRVCLDDFEVLQLFFRAAEDFARADVPDGTRAAFMSATMTAL